MFVVSDQSFAVDVPAMIARKTRITLGGDLAVQVSWRVALCPGPRGSERFASTSTRMALSSIPVVVGDARAAPPTDGITTREERGGRPSVDLTRGRHPAQKVVARSARSVRDEAGHRHRAGVEDPKFGVPPRRQRQETERTMPA